MHVVPDEDENASELQFGKDFFLNADERCLTIDEVCLFMQKQEQYPNEYVIYAHICLFVD